jgi:hypothetical protein
VVYAKIPFQSHPMLDQEPQNLRVCVAGVVLDTP